MGIDLDQGVRHPGFLANARPGGNTHGMELWELEAREHIRDLVARYNANGDSGRFDDVMDLFAPDASMEVDGIRHDGLDAIRSVFTTARGDLTEETVPRYLRHFTATLQIDVTSPTAARSRCYFEVLMTHGLDHWGRYLDEFAAVDGHWRFARRRVLVDGRTPGGWAASLP